MTALGEDLSEELETGGVGGTSRTHRRCGNQAAGKGSGTTLLQERFWKVCMPIKVVSGNYLPASCFLESAMDGSPLPSFLCSSMMILLSQVGPKKYLVTTGNTVQKS